MFICSWFPVDHRRWLVVGVFADVEYRDSREFVVFDFAFRHDFVCVDPDDTSSIAILHPMVLYSRGDVPGC